MFDLIAEHVCETIEKYKTLAVEKLPGHTFVAFDDTLSASILSYLTMKFGPPPYEGLKKVDAFRFNTKVMLTFSNDQGCVIASVVVDEDFFTTMLSGIST